MSEEALKAGARLFAAAIEHMNEGFDWDGADLQAACKKAGLTYERPYDAAVDEELDAEEGDTVWVPTHLGKMLLSLARENGGAK